MYQANIYRTLRYLYDANPGKPDHKLAAHRGSLTKDQQARVLAPGTGRDICAHRYNQCIWQSTEGYQQSCCPEKTSSWRHKHQVNAPKAAAATEPVLPRGPQEQNSQWQGPRWLSNQYGDQRPWWLELRKGFCISPFLKFSKLVLHHFSFLPATLTFMLTFFVVSAYFTYKEHCLTCTHLKFFFYFSN